MKSLRIALAVVLALLLLVFGAAAYLLNSLVSGEQKDRIVALASERFGTAVSFDSYSLDYASILALQPSLGIKKLTVANPAGFPQRNLLEADEVSLRVDLQSALDRKIEVRSLLIERPHIRIESRADGRTNLEVLLDNLKKSSAATSAQDTATVPSDTASAELSVGVTSVTVRDAVVLLPVAGAKEPRETLQSLNLTVSDIRAGSPSRLDLSTRVFDSANTSLHVAGIVGPLGGKGLPLEGKLEAQLALAEFPDAIRKQYLGELASAPGPDSRVRLALDVKGDLYGTTTGTGNVAFSEFLIGAAAENRLGLSGEAPLAIRAEKAISAGALDLRSKSAKLKLGSGEWAGDLAVARQGTKLSGEIRGAIESVDVNQMLTSFAASPDVVSGTLTVPTFQVAFQGNSAVALRRSLTGNGRLEIGKGQFQAVRVLAAIERALGGTPSDTGEFAKFEANFAIHDEAIALDQMLITGPAILLAGSGTVGFDEALDFRLESKLQGAAAELLKARAANLADNVSIPVTVAGTVGDPQIKPDLGSLTKRAVKGAVGSVLENLLKRREKTKEDDGAATAP